MSEIVICSWSLTLFTSCTETEMNGKILNEMTEELPGIFEELLSAFLLYVRNGLIVFEPLLEQTSLCC